MQVTTVGLDLAKNIFQVHRVNENGEVAFNQALRRAQLLAFTRNDKDIGVKNGMLGKVVTARDGQISVALDGDVDRLVRFDPRDFRNFDHGYAVTIHKSQGATVDQAYVLASRSMDKHLAYVAMTRHREGMRLFINNRDRPVWAMGQQDRSRPAQARNRDGPSMG